MMDTIQNRPSDQVINASLADANCTDHSGSEHSKVCKLVTSIPFASDPAVVVALGIRFGLMGRSTGQGIPASVRDGLRHHASQGEPACQLVLGWLDDMLLAEIEALEVAPLA